MNIILMIRKILTQFVILYKSFMTSIIIAKISLEVSEGLGLHQEIIKYITWSTYICIIIILEYTHI